jgi:hypothetical protein
MSRWILHPGWISRSRYVGEAEMRRLRRIPAAAEVIVLDGSRRRRFYGRDGDIHVWPEVAE